MPSPSRRRRAATWSVLAVLSAEMTGLVWLIPFERKTADEWLLICRSGEHSSASMPLLVDLIAAFAAGLLALLGARWYARSPHDTGAAGRGGRPHSRRRGPTPHRPTATRRAAARSLCHDRATADARACVDARRRPRARSPRTACPTRCSHPARRQLRRCLGIRSRQLVVDEWAESDHRARQYQDRRRLGDRARDRRRLPPPRTGGPFSS